MRMRNKPWAAPELNACPFFLRRPEEIRGRWREQFERDNPLVLELGCGKGFYLSGMAPRHPELNFIGIDLKDVVLAPARRNLVEAFHPEDPGKNVRLTAYNIEQLPQIMDERDTVSRIVICFCNPWPRPKHHKRRLTHPRRLAEYCRILAPNGQLWFKTDNDELFADTCGYLQESGYEILTRTEDLSAHPWPDDAETEHERMFKEKGICIKALTAVYRGRDSR